MGPIDYTMQVIDPIQAALEQRGLRFAEEQQVRAADQQDVALNQGQQRIDMAQQQFMAQQQAQAQAQAAARAQQERAAAGQQAFTDFMFSPNKTAEQARAVVEANPEMGQAVMEYWEGQNEDQKASELAFSKQFGFALNRSPDAAKAMLEDRAARAEAIGNEEMAATYRGQAQMLGMGADGVEVVKAQTLAIMAGVMDPKDLQAFMDTAGYSQPGAAAGGDQARVQSSQIISGRVSVQTMNDGTVRVVDTSTGEQLTGDAAAQAIAQAEQAGIEATGGSARARAEATRLADIELGRSAASERAIGTEVGTAEGGRIANAGSAERTAQMSLDLIKDLKADPGLPSVLGNVQGRLPAGIPGVTGGQAGTDAAARLAQTRGRVFLEAFESLKGGGAITQIEGEKAEQAMARLQTAQSEEAVIQALTELEEVYTAAVDRARKAGGNSAPTDNAAFIAALRAKMQRGETPTEEERARYQAIRGGQ